MELLFEPIRLGGLELPHRIVMAPLTRSRARQPGNVPTPLNACYYAQRASAALIISEATQVSMQGQGYAWTPGIHSREQIDGWRAVSEAVHAEGGRMFMQLWHVGRISHPALQPDQMLPVAPSAIRPSGQAFIENERGEPEFVPFVTPRPLQIEEMPYLVRQYVRGARNAQRAGMDGVEVHAANGYLLDQFLRDGSNKRDDIYGGSIENRARLMLQVMQGVAEEIGPDRTGIRLSPVTPANDASDSNPQPVFEYTVEQLDRLDLAYIHLIEGQTGGDRNFGSGFDYAALRRRFRGSWIVNNGYSPEMARAAVAGGSADLVAFGRSFISNPDLVARLRRDAPLAKAHRATFYGGGAEGYTDYPILEAAE